MGVRRIRANFLSVTGFVPNVKASDDGSGVRCYFESKLEREFATILRFDPDVATFSEQPLRMSFAVPGGRRRLATPDFMIHYVPSCNRKPEMRGHEVSQLHS